MPLQMQACTECVQHLFLGETRQLPRCYGVLQHLLSSQKRPALQDLILLLILQEEIEKVQERRAQRERERAEQEEMQQLLQRERGMAEAMELEAKEEAVSCALWLMPFSCISVSFCTQMHLEQGLFWNQCLPSLLESQSTSFPCCTV